ncbi:hypothetical protein KTN05_17275, partial [Paracoccus sp. Z118]|nr:hypothetical protein [Paracoccus sp. Z118]
MSGPRARRLQLCLKICKLGAIRSGARTIIGDLVAALKPRRHILRPIAAARVLTGRRRSPAADLALATVLAGVAGASNAGGFFALGAYTSHMTGYLSQLAD